MDAGHPGGGGAEPQPCRHPGKHPPDSTGDTQSRRAGRLFCGVAARGTSSRVQHRSAGGRRTSQDPSCGGARPAQRCRQGGLGRAGQGPRTGWDWQSAGTGQGRRVGAAGAVRATVLLTLADTQRRAHWGRECGRKRGDRVGRSPQLHQSLPLLGRGSPRRTAALVPGALGPGTSTPGPPRAVARDKHPMPSLTAASVPRCVEGRRAALGRRLGPRRLAGLVSGSGPEPPMRSDEPDHRCGAGRRCPKPQPRTGLGTAGRLATGGGGRLATGRAPDPPSNGARQPGPTQAADLGVRPGAASRGRRGPASPCPSGPARTRRWRTWRRRGGGGRGSRALSKAGRAPRRFAATSGPGGRARTVISGLEGRSAVRRREGGRTPAQYAGPAFSGGSIPEVRRVGGAPGRG